MAYERQIWVDGETIATAERMKHIEDGIADLYNAIFPIGQIVIKGDNEDYSNWLGFTWERTAVGKVLVGIDSTDTDFNTIGKNGGEKKHTLLQKEMPKEIGQALLYDSNSAEQPSETDTLVTQWSKKYRTGFENVVNQFGGGAHNNMPPYETFYFWKRTA